MAGGAPIKLSRPDMGFPTPPDCLGTREYQVFYGRIPAAVHSVGPDGLLLEVSDEWVAFMGYPRDEIIGRSLADTMDEESRRRYLDVELPKLHHHTQDGIREAEYRLRRRGGDWVEVLVRARAERATDGTFLRSLSVVVDVTARNRAEAQLRQLQKLEALGQMTGGIAHDFNNMLQIVGAALRLQDRHLPDGPARRFHTAAVDGAARASELARRLLSFARQTPLAPEALDAGVQIAALAKGLLIQALGQRARLVVAVPPGLWQALADPAQLDVALLNLALNARDAMAPNQRGTITVSAANVTISAQMPCDPSPAHAGFAEALKQPLRCGDYVRIDVADTGSGMDAATLARASEPFFTTKPPTEGTGLGVSQVWGFATQSGGALRLLSKPGAGTLARLYLPRATAAQNG